MASAVTSSRWCLPLVALLVGLSACQGTGPVDPPSPSPVLPDAARSRVEADRTAGVVADGKDAATLTVTLLGTDGSALADRAVTLEASGEGNTLTPASGKTDARGVMTARLVSTVPGAKRVRASVADEAGPVVLSTQPSIEFVPVPATRLAFLTSSIPTTTAGVALSPALEVALLDAEGRRVTSDTRAVTMEVATGPAAAALEGSVTVTPVNGVARFTGLVLKKAGTGYSLRATVGTLASAPSATFDVVPAAASVLELTGLADPMVAGSTGELLAQIKDAFGNVVTGYTGTLRFSSTDLAAVLPEPTALTAADAGRRRFPGVSLRSAGSQRVRAVDTARANLAGTLTVEVVGSAPAQLVFTRQPGNHSVRAPLGPVEVTLLDVYGNPTRALAPVVTVALEPASAGLSGTATGVPVNGVATFTTLNVAREGKGYALTASSPGLTSAISAAFDIRDDVAPARPVLTQGATGANSLTVLWTAVGDDGVLGTAASQELRYARAPILTDADFAAATLVPTGAPLPAGSAESATLSGLTPSTSYHVALKVVDDAGNAVRSASLPVSTDNAIVTQLVFSTQPTNGTAGVRLADVRVSLLDASGMTVLTANSAVTLQLSDGPAFTPVTVNAVSGVATFSGLRVDTAGSGYRFRASSGSLPAVQSEPFSIAPAAAATLVLTGPASPVVSGASSTVQVTLRDAFGNVATGYTGTVRFTSNDPAASLPADRTFTAADRGQASVPGVVLRTSGSRTVTATDTGATALTGSFTVDVVGGAATRLVLTVPTGPVTAGSPFSVQVSVRDSVGNPATGYTGTVAFTSSDGGAVLPAAYTFTAADAGQKTFSGVELRRVGAQSLTVADTATPSLSDSQSLTVIPGAATALELAAPLSATAGEAFSVRVTARDAFANVATGYTGTVSFTSDDPGATLPASYTFTGTDGGSRLFSVTARTSGRLTLTVSDGTRSDSSITDIASGVAASVTLRGLPSTLTAGTPTPVTVTLYDALGNVATGYTGTVRFTSDDPGAELPADYTFRLEDQGQRNFSVEPRRAGSRTFTVQASGAGSDSAVTNVLAASPTRLGFRAPPASGTVRAPLGNVTVVLFDAYGNVPQVSSPSVILSLTDGNPASTLSGTTSVAPVDGEATFSGLSLDQEGSGFRFVASALGLSGATSQPFDIVDNLAPDAAVLTAIPSSSNSVTVTWQAVGDDGLLGTAASQELRYAPTPITTEADFASATPVPLPAPQPPGTTESKVVTGLVLSTDHYFALKVVDGAGNASLSNSPRVEGDPCLACTPAPATCSANGRAVVTYAASCDPSTRTCQNTPTETACSAYETCSGGACVPVTAGAQAGRVIVSEFNALGSEFIELHNTTDQDVDVRGFALRNAAGQEVTVRAVTDPDGTASTPVLVPAHGVRHGIANPSGAVPGGVGFVYGEPSTGFTLADTGDALALYASGAAGTLEDLVDFRSFVTEPNTPLTASAFVGFAGSSTQLDPTRLTAAENDTATHWCVSFHPSGARGARIPNTAGALNGSCQVAVINEVLIDAPGTDDTRTFVELSGPGGSVIGGAKLTDVEGLGPSAGSLHEDNDFAPGEQDGEFVIPAGTRIPADGLLLIADASSSGLTAVSGFTPNVDVLAQDMDLENGGGKALQLVSSTGTLLDTLGHDATGANLATNTAYNGLALYETATALTPEAAENNAAPSLARSALSTDTDDNRADFHVDPSPTPGAPNDAVNFTVVNLTPDDAPAMAGADEVSVTGTDFSPGLQVFLGAQGLSCALQSSTLSVCTAPANAGGAVGQVDVTVRNPANVDVADVVRATGFTYTGAENETGSTEEADYCNLQYPASLSLTGGQLSPVLYGRIYEAGRTEADGAPAGVLAEVGYGTSGGSPLTSSSWRFFPASYNVQTGNDDEFMGQFLAPTVTGPTAYSYAFRFSLDGGLRWTYCDLDGAGSNSGLAFDTNQLGVMTVDP